VKWRRNGEIIGQAIRVLAILTGLFSIGWQFCILLPGSFFSFMEF
jgi:hypothetical protein